MPLAISITGIKADGQECIVFFNVAATGTYPVGGDTLNFATATQDPAFQGPTFGIPSSIAPFNLVVWDCSGNIANGVFPVLGTTISNSKVMFTTAFNLQLTNIPYPAPLTVAGGAKLQGRATFVKNV